MPFKVGDNVLVRYHTQDEKRNYPKKWNDYMDDFEGHVASILYVEQDLDDPRKGYHLRYNGREFWFISDSVQACYEQL